jgi:hypothetical protein
VRCHRQTYLTSGTAFYGSRVPLMKWFWTLYLLSADKGGISSLRLGKIIGVRWRTAYKLLRTLHAAMAARDSHYRLTELVEVDDTYIRCQQDRPRQQAHAGARGHRKERGCPTRIVTIEALDSLGKAHITDLAKRRLQPQAVCHADASPTIARLRVQATHTAKLTSPDQAEPWLPWVHMVISNLKRFLLGTLHGATRRPQPQEYVDEFAYRCNRRFWEERIPYQLLALNVGAAEPAARVTGA